MNIGELITRKSRGRAQSQGSGVSIGVIKNGHQKTPNTPAYCVSFGIMADVMRQMRFVVGDRVTLDIDPINSTATIRRVIAGDKTVSWKLSSRKGGVKGDSKKHEGSCQPSTFKFSSDDTILSALGMKELVGERSFYTAYTTSDKGIEFPLPKQYKVVSRVS